MSQRIRTIILVLCVVAIAGSLVAFLTTGMYPYTRFRDKEIETANTQTDLSDLFSDTGVDSTPPTKVESVNAIGLLPSGLGMASISVVSISGPALVAIGLVWWLGRRQQAKAAHAGPSPIDSNTQTTHPEA